MADGGTQIRETGRRTPSPSSKNICLVMRFEALPGVEDRLEDFLGDFAFTVRTEEGGCMSYLVTRPIGTQTHFVVHARFADWGAFELHSEAAHLERAMARLSPLLAAPLSMEIFAEL